MLKNKVWYSTQESRDKHITSILAIVETIFFVILTWGIAYYYDTYLHIYTALAIAPFLLLKTPKSTKTAIEWYLYKHNFDRKDYYKDSFFWFILTLSLFLSFLIIYFFSTKIIIHYESWKLLFLIILLGIILISTIIGVVGTIGVGVIGVVVRRREGVSVLGVRRVMAILSENKIKDQKILQNFIFLLLLPIFLIMGATLGFIFFLKALIIKFISTTIYTISNLKITFFTISKNWNEQITVNDIFYTPELLPKIHKENDFHQVSSFVSNFKKNDFKDKVLLLFIAPISSLGYLYRFSIKSTAWFFFPLAYLANLNALQNKETKNRAVKTQTWKKLFWFNIIILAVLFLYFKFTGQYLELFGLSEVQLKFITEKMGQLRDFFIPNAMWLLVVAVGLYFIMNTIISRQEHLEDKEYPLFLYWIIKLIYMLWMVFLGWHIVVFTNQYVLPELPRLFGML
ncbi:MAG: Unknown protein [uncultured Sulfurovum sp.]|uniref:Uncharacterized protein n=1 Tax=uncultured Sulfurovum sp. TaxID=269237 RepID=A0A6S6T8T0_9BACT|nr:MAG: Unknown protein [uncultured Sulfurovum sp.]